MAWRGGNGSGNLRLALEGHSEGLDLRRRGEDVVMTALRFEVSFGL